MAEGVIVEVKSFHGLWRTLHRGLKNFKIQAFRFATAQNLKRLATAPSKPRVELANEALQTILKLHFILP